MLIVGSEYRPADPDAVEECTNANKRAGASNAISQLK